MGAMMYMMPELTFQEAGAPAGSVNAGTIGGGGLPTDTSIATLGLSLALVPTGLSAVAVFPPFETYVDYRTRAMANRSRFITAPLRKHANFSFLFRF